jgi:hypothetical protein
MGAIFIKKANSFIFIQEVPYKKLKHGCQSVCEERLLNRKNVLN